MKLKKISIKNFRKLSDINFELSKNISVVVGPNAVGKSTIFEAIRLAKAILFPRAQDELRHVLIGLGASSAHFFQGHLNYDISALAGDVSKPVAIGLVLQFSENEIQKMGQHRPQITRNLVAAQLGRSADDPTLDLRAYFSTEMGRSAERDAAEKINTVYQNISIQREMEVKVEIDPTKIVSSDTIVNLFIAFLEQSLTPDKAIFSYFPADRSMPTGEVAIQVGPQDYKAQIDSHLALATAKYGRLKQTVVNHTVLARITDKNIKPEFDEIFDTFLPGKEFIGLTQKPSGLVAVHVKDKESGKVFDIDSLSSGEKGLVLSFLLFKHAISFGSLTLVDELELHLNSAVCRKIIPYLAQLATEKQDCQFIISTHSADIAKDAYERDDCELFHLRSEVDISPILPQDTREIVEAIRRLGGSTEQALTARAALYVEGEADVAILNSAFPDLLANIQVRALSGRNEIEKSIKSLQEAEKKGNLKERHSFLFDLDRKPTSLVASRLVRLEQLNKYCIENYLLDDVVLYDMVEEYGTHSNGSRGEFARELKIMALGQLEDVILQEVLAPFRAIRPSLNGNEIKGKSPQEIGSALIEKIQSEFSKAQKIPYIIGGAVAFERHCESRKKELLPIWENEWRKLCSGKLLLEALQRKYQINLEWIKLRTLLAEKLGTQTTDDITALRGVIERLVA